MFSLEHHTRNDNLVQQFRIILKNNSHLGLSVL